MHLCFPQWQGAGESNHIRESAIRLKDHMESKYALTFHEIQVPENHKLTQKNSILGYDEILEQLQATHDLLEKESPSKIYVIGGDCGVEICPISYLNKIHGDELQVLWLDAHADLNTPETSTSHLFHGMPLRALLGEGDSQVLNQAFSKLLPDQVTLMGVRDLDDPEQVFMEQSGINLIPTQKCMEGRLSEVLKNLRSKSVYIHIDLDVLDPREFPYVECPTQRGFSVVQLKNFVEEVRSKSSVAGVSIVEYSTPTSKGIDIIERFEIFSS